MRVMNKKTFSGSWTSVDASVFWNDIARSDHVLQLYENDGVFLDTLTGFIHATIEADQNAVAIATDGHLNALEARLETYGTNIERMISENRFIPVNVDEIITEFMIDGRLDESLLVKAASELLSKAVYGNRKFKVFGEIAPTLMAHGYKQIAVRVEQLFDSIIHESNCCLFCGYASKLFNEETAVLSHPACNIHSKIISGSIKQLTQVVYQDISAPHFN